VETMTAEKPKVNQPETEQPAEAAPFTTIELIARLTGTTIECRDLVDKWLLVTYDIPHTEAGDKARREFLLAAHAIGASHHTDSVYLMPWTGEAEGLALRLADSGKVCIWTSSTTDPARTAEITKSYDDGLRSMLDEVEERIDRIEQHQKDGNFKRAAILVEKTEKLLHDATEAIKRRGSAPLFLQAVVLGKRLARATSV
jgi:hypothetical protein